MLHAERHVLAVPPDMHCLLDRLVVEPGRLFVSQDVLAELD